MLCMCGLMKATNFAGKISPFPCSLISFENKTSELATIAYRKHSLRAHAFDIINKNSHPQAALTNQRHNLHRARVTKWQLRCHKAPFAEPNCDTLSVIQPDWQYSTLAVKQFARSYAPLSNGICAMRTDISIQFGVHCR